MACLGAVITQTLDHAYAHHIQRMSNYCAECRCAPDRAIGPDACPFTTLYWEFLLRHESLLGRNQRMRLQLRNLDRLDAATRRAIRTRSAIWRTG